MINKEEEKEILFKAINTYGEAIQKIVSMEECSELIIALESCRCGKNNNVIEETADVEIMCSQLEIMYDSKKIKEYDDRWKDINFPVGFGFSMAINSLAKLIQAISKTIRDENKHCEKEISEVKRTCKFLRTMAIEDAVDKIKEEKLLKLKGYVWNE